MRKPLDQTVKALFGVALAFAVALCSCGARSPQTEQTSPATETAEVNSPFTSFTQDIQTSVKSLKLRPAEQTFVSVTLRNTSSVLWASAGKDPVDFSYKWFDRGKMLPIEGERTALPKPLRPGESLTVPVKVVAPETTGELLLKITLVQEGVEWFMTAGAKPLELQVDVH
jgi:hypothetical protein